MKLIKTLIHVHTDYSYDSNIAVKTLARFLEREHFDCVAVTDHDSIEGARKLQRATDIRVIIGEEVTTRDGHLIGLFLEQRVPPGMSARETARAIHEQGGLVLLPHPFITVGSCALGETSWTLARRIDAVEVFNAQNLQSGANRRAHEFADKAGLSKYVGSDSHSASSIAPTFQIMPQFDTRADFLKSLRQAQWHTERHPASYFAGAAYRTTRHLLGLPLPSTYGAHFVPSHDIGSQRHAEPTPQLS